MRLEAIRRFIPVATFIEEVQAPYGGYPRLATLLIGGGWLVVTLLVAWFLTTRRKRIDTSSIFRKAPEAALGEEASD